MPYDARFHAFQEINDLLKYFLAPGQQLTDAQATAVHACAKKLAKDLTCGEYV